MKRWLSLALIVALLCAPVTGAALADGVEPLPGDATTLPAASGLTIEEGDATDAGETSNLNEETPPANTPETFTARYARATAEAEVRAEAASETAFAAIAAGSVVLMVGSAENGQVKAAFFTGELIVEGFIEAAALVELTDAEISAYMDAAETFAAAYNDDVNRPLAPVQCTFAETQAPPQAPDANENNNPDGEGNNENNNNPVGDGNNENNNNNPVGDGNNENNNNPVGDGNNENNNNPVGDGNNDNNNNPVGDGSNDNNNNPVGDGNNENNNNPDGEGNGNSENPDGEGSGEGGDGLVPVDGEGSGEGGDDLVPVDGEGAVEEPPVLATSIRLNYSTINIGKKELYSGLRVIPQPEGSVLPEGTVISWRISSGKILACNQSGQVYGRKNGTAYIYAKMSDGNEVACKVVVKNAPSKVYVSPTSLTLSMGQDGSGMTAQLKTSVPKKSAAGMITFISSDPAVATVSESGLVTAHAAGTATITVRAYTGKAAYCKVTVKEAPARVTFPEQSYTIGVGQKMTAVPSAQDANGSGVPANFYFSIDENSTDAGCVSLDPASGQITGVRKGQAVVKVVTHNNVVGSYAVTVEAAPASVALKITSVTIGKKELYSGLAGAVVLTAPEGEETCAAGLTWSVSNGKILAVNQKGQIYGRKNGTAYVYVTTHNGKKARCKVTVKKAPKTAYVSPTSLNMSAEGMTFQLKTAVTKKSGAGTISFTSNNPAVVTVSASGLVTAHAPGTATITVRAYTGKAAYCKITVKEAPAGVTFPEQGYTIGVGQKMVAVPSAQDANGGGVPANFYFSIDENSDDPACVKLDPASGQVTGVHKGRATVLAATHNGVVGSYTVDVVAAPQSVSLNLSSVTIGQKELYSALSCELKAPDGEETCAGSVTWSVSNGKVLAVNQQGQIYGRKAGTAYVYVTTHNGKSARCKVTIRKKITKFSISPNPSKLYAGESATYRVKVNSGAGGSITWASSDESIAIVNASGQVTALKAGACTIYARTYNGITAKSKLTVVGSVSSVSSDARVQALVNIAYAQLGKPYIYGKGYGTSATYSGFDCSGLTHYCYWQAARINLETSAYRQGNDRTYADVRITRIGDLQPGDLVFFTSDAQTDKTQITHAGLYVGGGWFIHASQSSQKVIKSEFTNYWTRSFSWGYRPLAKQ